MKCKYKDFFNEANANCPYVGEEHICSNGCGYYEKYQDLALDAMENRNEVISDPS